MSDSPSKVFQYMLVQLSLGTLPVPGVAADWRVYRQALTNDNRNAIFIFGTTPEQDGRLMSGQVIEHPGIQIRIRGMTDEDAEVKGMAIESALAGVKHLTVPVGGNNYLVESFKKTSGLTFIFQEEVGNRRHYTINGTITVREI